MILYITVTNCHTSVTVTQSYNHASQENIVEASKRK